MRIVDRIANEIIELLEERFNLKVKKDDYLDLECEIADMIKDELTKHLSWDLDLQKVVE